MKSRTRRITTHKNGWTPARRARQSALIRSWRPWTRSTGPRTVGGKTRTRLNARKHGLFGAEGRFFYQVMKEQRQFVRAIKLLNDLLDAQDSLCRYPGESRDLHGFAPKRSRLSPG